MASSIAEVDRLLHELERNLEEAKLSLKQQEELLGRLKVFGRNPATAGPIFTQQGIRILCRYGLDKGENAASREALRCLANAFLLNEPARQKFVDLGYAPKAADRLKVEDSDDEFLICRILFLMTYNTSLDFLELESKHSMASSLNQHVGRHAAAFSKPGHNAATAPPIEQTAMVETFKLIFNITYHYPDMVAKFSASVRPLIEIVMQHTLSSPPLQPPITSLLNTLLNLDLSNEQLPPADQVSDASPLFAQPHPEAFVSRLTSVLDKAMREHPEKDLDQAAAPLCTLIRRIYELAPPDVQTWMRSILLPTNQDRERPLGQGDSISARLLHLSCSPNLPTLRDNISSLLFELSDKDPNKFVRNIGYGFASGFLASHSIEIPKSATSGESSSSAGNTMTSGDVNPVTGQRFSAEDADRSDAPEMTEEEKEREAERLFVLFERLRATGVVDVKNPVQQAKDEGRFEELD